LKIYSQSLSSCDSSVHREWLPSHRDHANDASSAEKGQRDSHFTLGTSHSNERITSVGSWSTSAIHYFKSRHTAWVSSEL